jgi:hypothetical protein
MQLIASDFWLGSTIHMLQENGGTRNMLADDDSLKPKYFLCSGLLFSLAVNIKGEQKNFGRGSWV